MELPGLAIEKFYFLILPPLKAALRRKLYGTKRIIN
jgi:hypothetical protein